MSERPIIYEPHPVTPERKAELLAQGYCIIDAKYQPADEQQDDPPSASAPKQMKVDELRAELTARGIEFDEKAKKDELLALLEQSLAAEKEGGGDGA